MKILSANIQGRQIKRANHMVMELPTTRRIQTISMKGLSRMGSFMVLVGFKIVYNPFFVLKYPGLILGKAGQKLVSTEQV